VRQRIGWGRRPKIQIFPISRPTTTGLVSGSGDQHVYRRPHRTVALRPLDFCAGICHHCLMHIVCSLQPNENGARRQRINGVEITTQTATRAVVDPILQERDPDRISGGHLVAKELKAEGAEVIFTLCGGYIIDIYDGCVDEGIAVVDVRHEQVAAHAADGYARVTVKPGCAVVTAGPRTTDAITGVANAFRAESPMLLIGGQGALNQHKMGSLQDLPQAPPCSGPASPAFRRSSTSGWIRTPTRPGTMNQTIYR
jgi:hypothetical protein